MIRRPHLYHDDPREFRLKLSEGNAHLHVAAFLAQRRGLPVPHYEGTGCVMAAGGRRYLREAFMTVSRIRESGWDWPIQIWHLGHKELAPDMPHRFDHLDVEFVDAQLVANKHPVRILQGWPLKSYMVANCPFRNVLLLDSDSAPVRDPMPFFESPEFQQHGAVFFPDIAKNLKDYKAFGFIGLKAPIHYTETESGQLMVDKVRCWRALELVRWMNDYADFWFKYMHGDKETWPLAFMRHGTRFTMAPPCRWEPFGIEQNWFDGQPLFEHRLSRKYNPGAYVSPQDFYYGQQFDGYELQARNNVSVLTPR